MKPGHGTAEVGSRYPSPAVPARLIPTEVHRIWLRDPIPERYSNYTDKWVLHHPDWDVKVWRNYADLPTLYNGDLFAAAKDHYPKDWKRFQADLLRLELLWRFGGVYADMDCYPIQGLDELIARGGVILGRSPQKGSAITNAFIAAPPQHPFIGLAILTLPDSLEKHGNRNLAQSVGPWHLNRTYEADDWPDVTVIDDLYTSGEWVVHLWANAKRKRGEKGWRF